MLPLNNCSITSIYGENRQGRFHRGMDMISASGDRLVKAISSGIVRIIAYEEDGFGYYTTIQQQDGYRAIYAHLDSINVQTGQIIEAGDVIGIEGNTGNSTGIHLHLELRSEPYSTSDSIDIATYLGIENKTGLVRPLTQFEIGQEIEALQYLIENGRITSGDYWLNALMIVKNLDFLFIKWANDVAYLNLYM